MLEMRDDLVIVFMLGIMLNSITIDLYQLYQLRKLEIIYRVKIV